MLRHAQSGSSVAALAGVRCEGRGELRGSQSGCHQGLGTAGSDGDALPRVVWDGVSVVKRIVNQVRVQWWS